MAPVPGWFRWLSYALAALLATSVVLQYNDPDPLRWMLIYGAGAAVSVALPARRAAGLAGLALGVIALAWAAPLVYEVWDRIALSDLTGKMSEQGGAVEVGREAGGLLIEGAWLLGASAFRRRRA